MRYSLEHRRPITLCILPEERVSYVLPLVAVQSHHNGIDIAHMAPTKIRMYMVHLDSEALGC